MKRNRTPLGAGLLVKGTAIPSSVEADGLAVSMNRPSEESATTPVRSSATTYHKSLTVKLDEQRYMALKLAGLEMDTSSQEIFVEALDDWLRSRRG